MPRRSTLSQAVFTPKGIDVHPDIDNEAFFRGPDGLLAIVTGRDIDRVIPADEAGQLRELDRYWLNFPYAYVSICRSHLSNELRYFVVEPTLTDVEHDVVDFLTTQIPGLVRYTDSTFEGDDASTNRKAIREQVFSILHKFGLNDLEAVTETYQRTELGQEWSPPSSFVGEAAEQFLSLIRGSETSANYTPEYSGPDARQYGAEFNTEYLPLGGAYSTHPALIGERQAGVGIHKGTAGERTVESVTLTTYQVYKILYYIERNFLGLQRIDAINSDVNVEDISCNGPDDPVFVYHSAYGQVLTNISHHERELRSFISRLAQDANTEISRREPQADIILTDGSRGQITLGNEVSGKGTNYTIRQFKHIPFTPVDLLNWKTYEVEQMAMLWLAVEYDRSMLIAGGAASGKTTALNALGLFAPGNEKVITIEDTQEIKLPHRNWTQSVTRESVGDDADDITVYDHLRAALRQRPDYLLLGEVRGEEGRDLFQMMSTGHTTFSTFHADNVDEVIKRMTTDPINVPKSVFSALDLVSINKQTVVDGKDVRRNTVLAEVTDYAPERDALSVDFLYKWNAATDTQEGLGRSEILNELRLDMGWSRDELQTELKKRELVLSYLVANDIKKYHNVAPVIQGFMKSNSMMLRLIDQGAVEESLSDLRKLKTIEIDVDEAGERTIPRPETPEEVQTECEAILAECQSVLEQSGVPPVTEAELNVGMTTSEAESATDSDTDTDPDDDSDSETDASRTDQEETEEAVSVPDGGNSPDTPGESA